MTGTAIVDGNLALKLINGFVPTSAQTFTIFNAASLLGVFDNAGNGQRLTTANGDGSFLVNYGPSSPFNPNQVVLSAFQAVLLPGDYNHNNVVDVADYVVWRKTLGQTGTGLAADGNGNGTIDNGDFNVWRARFGQTAGSGSGSCTVLAVPEPISVAMLIAGGILTTCPRRRAVVS